MSDISTEDFLAHFGILGMHWGVRKKEGSKNTQGLSKKQKLALGITAGAVLTAGALTTAIILKKRVSLKQIKNITKSEPAEKLVKKLINEPSGIVYGTRGKEHGFAVLKNGGIENTIGEFEKAGLVSGATGELGRNEMRRYGDNLEKIAIMFDDPSGRTDAAGRVIPHLAVIPKHMAKDVKTFDDAVALVWPKVKSEADAIYSVSKYDRYNSIPTSTLFDYN